MTVGLWVLLIWAMVTGFCIMRRLVWHWRGLAILGGLLGLAVWRRKRAP
jgi:hypothetical protein